jgi:hypothetical protein
MISFVVRRNGKRLCRAGIDGECVLSALVTYVDVTDSGPKRRTTLDVNVTGLNSTTREHIEWLRADIKPGDRIEILVTESPSADPPVRTSMGRTMKQMAADNLGRIKARRKALLQELRDLDRNEGATRKQLGRRRTNRSTRRAGKAPARG